MNFKLNKKMLIFILKLSKWAKNRKKVPNSRRRLQSIVILRSKSATKKLVLFYYFLQVELCKGLLLFTAASYAQNSTVSTQIVADDALEEVIVTGTKRETKLLKTALAVTALSQNTLDSQGITIRNIGDVLTRSNSAPINGYQQANFWPGRTIGFDFNYNF